MKKILGLDLGTNSIGWALIEHDFENKQGRIFGMGSRIIPMSQDIIGKFNEGSSISQTAERTNFRSIRRLRERYLLRRERLHRVLNILGFLPEHYKAEIDFDKHFGKFFKEKEPKIAYSNKQFIFKESFEEMLEDFKKHQSELLDRKNKKGEPAKIPSDWTIYYLRRKALTQKIEKQELAWILLNFNQKRGYYQLRGEDEEVNDKREYVILLKVALIEKGEADKKNNKKNWYNITLENGWIYSATFYSEPQWLNAEKEFLVTEELDKDGNIKIVKDRKTDKNGKEKRRITPLPSFEEIDLMSKTEQDKIYKKIKAKTEITITNSGKTVGTYIYKTLLKKPTQKIRGKLIRTIERKFYKDELKQILEKQIEFHIELKNEDLYNDCIRELYGNNDAHQLLLSKKDFIHLFINDIIFYHRPLKSQKSTISNCSLEHRRYTLNGVEKTEYLKTIPKSNPLYQEFRIWQWVSNMRIYKIEDDTDVTRIFIADINEDRNKYIADIENLVAFLMTKKEVDHEEIVKHFLEPKGLKSKELKAEIAKYRWNYVYDSLKGESKKYPCNETGYEIRKRLEKTINVPDSFLTTEIEQELWHIIYSVTDKIEFEKALKSFAKKFKLDEVSFTENFKKFHPFKSEYGSYSVKAIKKLLPLMRIGKYWKWNAIEQSTKERIGNIITGEYDKTIKERVREKAINLTNENHFQGLQPWLASYIVYDRHSEANNTDKWNSIEDLKAYLKEFKQHSLRNPIVEQVVVETLRVVSDIWEYYGKGAKDYLNEIHIELGREMKNTAEERKRITDQVSENENANLRIKALLAELKNDPGIKNVRPYSPSQQEILKIYEDGALNSDIQIEDDILKISKTAQPTNNELKRYKLWLEQKYRSPYTGEMIPLSRLFTSAYEIEHIIPQSRFFDDSFSNKVICETSVNKLKDNQLGLEFIKNHHGEIVDTNLGEVVKIFSENDYTDFVKQHYEKNRGKKNKLLLEEIPEKMIERQLNDTRYISKFIMSVLSNIVRADKSDDGVNSKNIIPSNGKITDRLKQEWGLNDIWNDLILPRFERMNTLTQSSSFTSYNEKHQKYLPTVPIELSKGFQKKRIDHRHHAMDAMVIACATRDHVNLLNNKHAKSPERFDLNRKLRKFEEFTFNDAQTGKEKKKQVPTDFLKPWDNFVVDTRNKLETVVISFKQNLRVINKATNHYEKWIEKDGQKIKETVKQEGVNWAIRKPLHKDTVSGKVTLPRIKVPKGKILTATRKSINATFDLETIENITDTGIQKILIEHLRRKENNPEIAFSPEGIEDMNKNIRQLNNGKPHQPIYKARIFETGTKFELGQSGNRKFKYVEAGKGTNLFFAVYRNKELNRNYDTVPLNIVIERQKQGLNSVPEKNEKSDDLLFYLSPNDLVYIPTEEENINIINWDNLNKEQISNIYKTVSFSGNQIFFIRHNIATSIVDKKEFSSLNKMERAIDGKMIKDVCIKLKLDRLGKIKPA